MAVVDISNTFQMSKPGAHIDNTDVYNSNRNLLDNPFFTINQRGAAVGTNINANRFVADRWQAIGTIGATRNSDGSLTINDTLFHKLPTDLELAGKTVTLSVLYADGTTEANTFQWSGTSTQYFTYGRAVVYASAYQINFNSFTKNVKAFKLERGAYSTLANDDAPIYGQELEKCKWYFKRIKSELSYDPVGYGIQNSSTRAYIKIPGQMRVAPSASFVGILRLVGNASASVDVTSLGTGGTDAEGIVVLANTAGSLTANHAYTMYLGNTSSYIDLSADL